MGLSKSSSKREVYSDTVIPIEARKALNRQPNCTSIAVGERRTNLSPPKSAERRRS